MRHILAASLGVLLTCTAARAISQTDFSGRWTTDPDPAVQPPPAAPGAAPQRGAGPGGGPAAPRGNMGSGWGPTITITQNAQQLTVEYAFFARGDMQPPLRFVFALDGSETKNTVMMGHGMQAQTSKTKWDGAKLAITTRHSFIDVATGKPATTEMTQTLSVESATLLVVEVTRAGVGSGQATTTKSTYRKLSY